MGRLRLSAPASAISSRLRRAVETARELGLDGIELDSSSPDLASRSARRDIRRFVERTGLVLSALRGEGLADLGDPNALDRLVPEMTRRIALAEELGTGILTVRLGAVPERADDPARRAMSEALEDLSREAERRGVFLAAVSAEAPPARLAGFLGALSAPTVRAGLDPAALVARGHSAVEAASLLGPFAAHCRAADARAGGGEKPLGEGDVPWAEYLAALEAAGYSGFHSVDGGPAGEGASGIQRAIAFLGGL